MLSLRERFTPPTPFHGSMRRALRDDYLAPAGRISIREQLARQVVYDAIVIQVHGVHVDPDFGYGNFEEHARAIWPDALRRTRFVHFSWGYEPIPAWSTQIGTRLDLVYGISDRAWAGTAKLADAIGRIQAALGRQLPICVLAHSQGCAVTLAAAQGGLHLDNVIFMGSPLDQTIVNYGFANTHLSQLLGILRGELINCSSAEDGTTLLGGVLSDLGNALPPGTPPKPIGRDGLPQRFIDDPRVTNLTLEEVDHFGDDGWWSSNWQAPSVPWVGETREHFARILASQNLPHAPVTLVPRLQRAIDEHEAYVNGDTRHGWFGDDTMDEINTTVYVPGQAVVSWHFENKDFAEYSLDVERGQLRAQLFEAVGLGFERQSTPKLANAGAGPVSDRLETDGVSDAVYMLTLTNPGVEAAIVRLRFRAEDI